MIKLPVSFSGFKKYFRSVFSYNKKALIIGISIALFLSVFSFQTVHAADLLDWVEEIFDALEDVVDRVGDTFSMIGDLFNWLIRFPVSLPLIIIVWMIAVFAMISGIIFAIIAGFLNQLIATCLSIPVISGWVVETGFEFTKNFANMFIILILAFIGLATILKIREYEARKILPKLIMVALLINFTPVMVGFIVDIANLFTNFFFTEIIESNAIANLIDTETIFNDIKNAVDKMVSLSLNYKLSLTDLLQEFVVIIISSLVKIAFFTIASLVFIMVILLLFARIIILWILVILAPIAFFSQILPEGPTVKAILPSILHWNEWWKTLIQWSFLTIPLGFFLYLSAGIMSSMGDIMTLKNTAPIVLDIMGIKFSIRLNDIMESIIGPMTAIGMLIAGIMISVESMPDIAKKMVKSVTKGVKKIGKRARKEITERGKRVGKMAASRVAVKLAPGIQKWGGRQRVSKKFGWGLRRKIGAVTEIAAGKARSIGEKNEIESIENAKKRMEGETKEGQMLRLQLALKTRNGPKIIGAMESMQEGGNLDDAEKSGIIGEKERKKYMARATSLGRKQLQLYDINSAAELDPRWKDGSKETREKIINEILVKIKHSDVKLIGKKSLTDNIMKEAMVDTFNGNQMAAIGKNFGRDIVDGIQVVIESRGSVHKIAEKNPNLALWLHGNAAQNVGLSLPIPPGEKALKRTEVQKIVAEARKKITDARKETSADESAVIAEGIIGGDINPDDFNLP